jgi:NAD(P)H-hydrate epimerase
VRAEVTVAMAAEKLGTATAPGALHAGRVEVADIGIPLSGATAHMVERRDVAGVLPRRSPDAHKRSGGAVALLAGSDGMTGAAVLSARGAVRTGAGYATVGTTPSVDAIVAATLPEVLSAVVTDQDVVGPEGLADFSSVLDRANVLAIGPGLGAGASQRALVEKALATVELPMVVDADGLNVLAGHTEALADRRRQTVITPHPGELGRLLGMSTEQVQSDRLGAARRAAELFSCVVLLKGYRTVVADPSGNTLLNPTGGAELATAGTGDVLTGVVAALIAAGVGPVGAAWAGAYLHGLAGHFAAQEKGAAGVVAWDVAEGLPHALEECSHA